jgi:hypothetical protein
MLVDPSNPAAGSRVTGAIRQASQATGASFNYLLATAQVESGVDPQAGVTVAKIDGKPFVKAAADVPADVEIGGAALLALSR